jgi:hypothetical protein
VRSDVDCGDPGLLGLRLSWHRTKILRLTAVSEPRNEMREVGLCCGNGFSPDGGHFLIVE